MDIRNKVAVVTGASKGIGKAIALQLAREGAHVALSARGKDALEDTARDIEALGRKTVVFAGDMRDEKSIKSLIKQTVDTLGRLDILVNNAGVGRFYPVAEMPTEQWDEMFDLNVRGLFIATRESLPYLRQAGESVVINIASLAGKNSFKTGGGYSATKHAVVAFSRSLMLEERDNGIRVLTLCPGSVDTAFFDNRHNANDPKRDRILKPQDVADTAIHMIKIPQRAMVSEIDIRPTNP